MLSSNKLIVLFLFSLSLFGGCYNAGDKTLIPKQEYVPEEVGESYNIKVEPKVDILFLIDNSNSMRPYQIAVAENISAFTSAMDRNKFLDYQIGILSTSFDASEISSIDLAGDPKVIKRSMGSDGLVALQKNILALGTGGRPYESFFDPIRFSLDSNHKSVLNSMFFRSDSFFVLIIVSDSFDQSAFTSGFKTFDSILNLKSADSSKVLGYSVLAYPEYFNDDCEREENPPNNLFDFMSLFSNAYNSKIIGGGGIQVSKNDNLPRDYFRLTNVFSLCDANFGKKLVSIGDDIRLRVSQQIPLPVRPIDGTIHLKYGKQIVDPKWWKYDFGTNSIILDPEVDLDESQKDSQLYVKMKKADPNNTIGKPLSSSKY